MDNLDKEVEELFEEKQDLSDEQFSIIDGYSIKEYSTSLLNLSKLLNPKQVATFLLVKFGMPVSHVYKLLRYPGKKSCIKEYNKTVKILRKNDVPIRSGIIQKMRFNK